MIVRSHARTFCLEFLENRNRCVVCALVSLLIKSFLLAIINRNKQFLVNFIEYIRVNWCMFEQMSRELVINVYQCNRECAKWKQLYFVTWWLLQVKRITSDLKPTSGFSGNVLYKLLTLISIPLKSIRNLWS